ncbi:MAG: XTP/dITP diphosphatase [Firmicutes bacterium]|nr:XTP/dITP diphosphatase [Bacillota bacterium]
MAGRILVVASRNPGKVREIRGLLSDLDIEILSLADFPGVRSPVESGSTFEENAAIKAKHAALATGYPCVADDSGLEVEALGGLPGVRSARFAGDGATDEENNGKLLALMRGLPPARRSARFKCAVAIGSPAGYVETVVGVCEGIIAEEPRGSLGFGYDPVFVVPHLGKTFAELDTSEKNDLSHRGKALRAARPLIVRMLGVGG